MSLLFLELLLFNLKALRINSVERAASPEIKILSLMAKELLIGMEVRENQLSKHLLVIIWLLDEVRMAKDSIALQKIVLVEMMATLMRIVILLAVDLWVSYY